MKPFVKEFSVETGNSSSQRTYTNSLKMVLVETTEETVHTFDKKKREIGNLKVTPKILELDE